MRKPPAYVKRITRISFMASIVLVLLTPVIFYFIIGAKNSYSVVRLRQSIAQTLPVGSTKSQVVTWLETHNIEYIPVRYTANRNLVADASMVTDAEDESKLTDLFAVVWRAKFGTYCQFATELNFAFDSKNQLIWFNVRDNSNCN